MFFQYIFVEFFLHHYCDKHFGDVNQGREFFRRSVGWIIHIIDPKQSNFLLVELNIRSFEVVHDQILGQHSEQTANNSPGPIPHINSAVLAARHDAGLHTPPLHRITILGHGCSSVVGLGPALPEGHLVLQVRQVGRDVESVHVFEVFRGDSSTAHRQVLFFRVRGQFEFGVIGLVCFCVLESNYSVFLGIYVVARLFGIIWCCD